MNKSCSKKIASEGRATKLNNLIRGGKKWDIERTIAGQHVTHYDGPKGFNVNTPNV
ncbi:MAG: hypothetical protein ACXVHR_09085 [Methanobacterium sp.]